MGIFGLDPQFVGKSQVLLGVSRAWNTVKVTKSALAKVAEMELSYGLDLSFHWSLASGGNFVIACVTSGLKANTKSKESIQTIGWPGKLTSLWPTEF